MFLQGVFRFYTGILHKFNIAMSMILQSFIKIQAGAEGDVKCQSLLLHTGDKTRKVCTAYCTAY